MRTGKTKAVTINMFDNTTGAPVQRVGRTSPDYPGLAVQGSAGLWYVFHLKSEKTVAHAGTRREAWKITAAISPLAAWTKTEKGLRMSRRKARTLKAAIAAAR